MGYLKLKLELYCGSQHQISNGHWLFMRIIAIEATAFMIRRSNGYLFLMAALIRGLNVGNMSLYAQRIDESFNIPLNNGDPKIVAS